MSKLVKDLIQQEYQRRLDGQTDALVISLRGIDANTTNEIRTLLREKQIHVTTVRNNLFSKTFSGASLGALGPVLIGSSSVAYGAETVVDVAREIVKLVSKFPGIELKGAVLDGQLFEGDAGVKALSKFPTRDEAISKVVGVIIGPAGSLMAAVKGPGSSIVGLVKAIEDKLEKGEAIAKVS